MSRLKRELRAFLASNREVWRWFLGDTCDVLGIIWHEVRAVVDGTRWHA